MPDDKPVIWIYADDETRGLGQSLELILRERAKPLLLGPAGAGWAQIKLSGQGDFGDALESCPPELRPGACVNMSQHPPRGLDCLPCPVLGLDGAPGLEGHLVEPMEQVAGQVLAEYRTGFHPDWLKVVQVNMPLRDLVGRYSALVSGYPLNLEVGLDAHAMDVLGQKALHQAVEMVKGRRITVHMPFFDLVPGSADPLVSRAARERLEQAAAWALKLGAVQVVMHLGMDPIVHADYPPFIKRFAANLAPMVETLNQGGCKVAVENTYDPGPGPLLKLMEHWADKYQAGVCLDVGHVIGFSSTALEKWWGALGSHIIEMHLHDNDGGSDQHLPVGWGSVDWAFLHRALGDLSKPPVLTLEPHSEAFLWASLRGLSRLWGDLWKW